MKESYSISQLAKLARLDRATVTKRLEKIVSTGGAKGAKLYALSDALPALIMGERTEMDEAKLRKTQAEADLKEHELAIERGDYLPVKEVESQRVKECQWLYNRLLTKLPREISAQLYKADSPTHIAEILKHDIGRLMNEWRDL
jgi:Protein of unknown function (DUF1441)